MLFDWIKEHMPRIAKEVLVEVVKKIRWVRENPKICFQK